MKEKMQENLQRLEEKLKEDNTLMEKLMQQETPEDVQVLLKDHGVAMTMEEIQAISDALVQYTAGDEEGELSEESLEEVAGGGIFFRSVGSFMGDRGGDGCFIQDVIRGRW